MKYVVVFNFRAGVKTYWTVSFQEYKESVKAFIKNGLNMIGYLPYVLEAFKSEEEALAYLSGLKEFKV